MQNKSLIELAHSIIELDPDAPENHLELGQAYGELGHKVNSYVFLKNYAESQIKMLRDEKSHLDRQIKSYERLLDGLSCRAIVALGQLCESKLKSDTGHTISLRQSERLEITDLTKIPKKYVIEEISYTADKTAIKAALKSGEVIDGVNIIKNDYVVFK